jgi:hypothetical protein
MRTPTTAYVPQQVIRRGRILAWTTELGAITAEALAERDALAVDVARNELAEAVELAFMERHAVLVGYPELYTATVAGRRLARKHAEAGGYTYPAGLRTARVTIRDARHAIACASVVAALERRYSDHRTIVERVLHREERELGSGRRLASVDIRRHGETRSHYPDLVIWPPPTPEEPTPLPTAGEVELTMKSKEELIAICRALARAVQVGQIEAVLYWVDTAEVEKRLLQVIDELKVEEMIVVNPLGEIIESLPGFDLSQLQIAEAA